MTLSPTSANTARDPYSYYAELRARAPVFRDSDSGLLIATTDRAVRAAFGARGRTRPTDVPVPRQVEGTAAGRIFGRLVRMTDGEVQSQAKSAMVTAISGLSPNAIGREAEAVAKAILARGQVAPTDLGFMVPVRTMAGVLGFAANRHAEITDLIADFVLCISPLSGPREFNAAIAAAKELEREVTRLVEDGMPGLALDFRDVLLGAQDFDAGLCIANAIGLLSQTFDATGALISVALETMARHPDKQEMFHRDAVGYLRETARYDAPIQNTRRVFEVADELMGVEVRPGDALLLLLASANRDPEANADPDRFDPTRRDVQSYTFSVGPHRCPGEAIALNLAAGTLRALLAEGFAPESIDLAELRYRPSVNARIPVIS